MENLDKNTAEEIISMDEQPIDKIAPMERRVEIKKLIEEKGLHALNRKDLGRQFGVSDVQIARDIEQIMGDLPPVDWTKLFNKTLYDIDRSLDIANKALDNTTDSALRGKLTGQISEILLRKTAILEKMEKLLPTSAKAEPVTVVYRSVDSKNSVKPKEETKTEQETPRSEPDG